MESIQSMESPLRQLSDRNYSIASLKSKTGISIVMYNNQYSDDSVVRERMF